MCKARIWRKLGNVCIFLLVQKLQQDLFEKRWQICSRVWNFKNAIVSLRGSKNNAGWNSEGLCTNCIYFFSTCTDVWWLTGTIWAGRGVASGFKVRKTLRKNNSTAGGQFSLGALSSRLWVDQVLRQGDPTTCEQLLQPLASLLLLVEALAQRRHLLLQPVDPRGGGRRHEAVLQPRGLVGKTQRCRGVKHNWRGWEIKGVVCLFGSHTTNRAGYTQK